MNNASKPNDSRITHGMGGGGGGGGVRGGGGGGRGGEEGVVVFVLDHPCAWCDYRTVHPSLRGANEVEGGEKRILSQEYLLQKGRGTRPGHEDTPGLTKRGRMDVREERGQKEVSQLS